MPVVIPSAIASAIKEVLVKKLSVPAEHKTPDGQGTLKIQDNRLVIVIKSKDEIEKFTIIRMSDDVVRNLYDALVHCYVYDPDEPHYLVKIEDCELDPVTNRPVPKYSFVVMREGSAVSICLTFLGHGNKTFYLPTID